MRNNTALKALYTADILKMRGRGSGCYDYQDYTAYDAGCFDWDVECVADAQQGYEYDFEHYLDRLNIGEEEYVDERPMSNDPSTSTQRGMEVVDSFRNGDAPITISPKLEKALNLTSTGITAHTFALEGLQKAAESATNLAALGNLAKCTGGVGAGLGLVLSYNDLTDGNATAQDWGMFAASAVGAAVTAAGILASVAIPLWVVGIPVVMTFVAYTLPDDGDQPKSGY